MTPVIPTVDQPVVRALDQFDPHTGSLPERLLFNHRWIVLVVCLLITAV